MFDYLNSYDDMGVFDVLLDEYTIADALNNLCEKMNFMFLYHKDRCTIYKCKDDERSFLLSIEGTTPEHFFTLFIKCRSSLEKNFYSYIDKQLQDMYDGWGCTKPQDKKIPNTDLLTRRLGHNNYFVKALVNNGLINKF